MYLIRGLLPRTDIMLGAHGFMIGFDPCVKDKVADSGLDQAKIDAKIDMYKTEWLESCGYNPRSHCGLPIRVKWGQWGPEHISVPGNACGLDIDRSSLGNWLGGPCLQPHNIDNRDQKMLLLMIFTEIMDDVALFARSSNKH